MNKIKKKKKKKKKKKIIIIIIIIKGSVVSKGDPTMLYSKIKKIGQGASGSVFVAKSIKNNQIVNIYICIFLFYYKL